MDIGLLGKIFGRDQQWQGPCTVVLNAEASVQIIGADSIGSGGSKVYAQRMICGRVNADAVCLLQDGTGLLIIQQQKTKQSTGEEVIKQALTVADPAQVVAIEFFDTVPLTALGIPVPPPRLPGSHSGIHMRPKLS